LALLLEGEAGIGKTTLWLRATEDAVAEGFRVFIARGAPTEVTFAYAAIHAVDTRPFLT
jgi:MoxR-like ATPase